VPNGNLADIIAETEEERELSNEMEPTPSTEAPNAANQGRTLKYATPLTGIRKAIAEHMQRSLTISAQLTYMGEIDASKMMKLREKLIAQGEPDDVRVTYTDMMIAAAARTLSEYPLFNASLIDDELRVWQDINIGVAVNVENGLIVPVVRNADQKSLPEISRAVRTLMTKARERKLARNEIQGGTFTITNFGALGGGYQFATVIINQPEVAILGTGAITDRPVARDGQVVIRPIIPYSLTFDHRVNDGGAALFFMESFTKLVEDPGSWLD